MIDKYLQNLTNNARGQLENIISRAKVEARTHRKNAETVRDRAADTVNDILERLWINGYILYEEYTAISKYYLKQIKRA